MSKWKTILCLLFLQIVAPVDAGVVSAIPFPKTIEEQQGSYALKHLPIVYASDALKTEAAFLAKALSTDGQTFAAEKGASNKGGVMLRINPSMKTPESYRLAITPSGIGIEGADKAGVFYGIQTLLHQVNAAKAEGKAELASVRIADEPRYSWRGFMFDEARHFFGKEKVKQLLDVMAYYKLNTLHWHLTDEPGWRIEIKKYPRLSTVGGVGTWSVADTGKAEFYTQEDIKEIVAYAAERHITVIPEIDMPGHATAANRAYPEYSGGGTKDHPEYTFNPGKEKTYTYLTDILREVAQLFPAPYLHLGGDEVAFGIKAWETDPDVQALMKKEGMKNVRDAENYFNTRMAAVLKKMNKTMIGWDELLAAKLDPANTVIMWWRHDRPNMLKQSLAEGYRTVMCPRIPLYFDFIQHKDHKWGRTWNGFSSMEGVYEFPDKDFAKWNLPAEQMKLILGIQANLWTERIQHAKRADFMTYPRLCALAESAWSVPEVKDYEDFTKRLEHAYRLFDSLNIYYYDNRDHAKHPEPAGAQKGKQDVPMDFRD